VDRPKCSVFFLVKQMIEIISDTGHDVVLFAL